VLDLIGNLGLGFATALSPVNLLLAFIGCLVGTLIGVLPGIGPIATIAMLLPLTFKVDPTGALIMLAGIYYGAQYGGSTTAILVNIPGEATSVVTALDGHAMARKGQAGIALGIAAIASFFAGTVATLVIAAIGAPLTKLALLFGPAEYFGLMVLGLGLAIVLARGSVLKAVIMVVFGLLLATIGQDLETGQERLTLGFDDLADGIDFAVLAMGVFGIAEILRNLESPEARNVVRGHIGRLLPSLADLRRAFGPIVRATGLGSVLGILPGNGAVLAPFASYTLEKKLAKDPSRFGKGAIEGVAGAFFGLVGYVLIKLGLEPAPMLLGFVLGRLMEEKLRQALALSEGSFMTFVERPVSAVLLLLALAVLVIAVLPTVRKSREEAFQE
jgi:putative tricarboxylic transport membrane protein